MTREHDKEVFSASSVKVTIIETENIWAESYKEDVLLAFVSVIFDTQHILCSILYYLLPATENAYYD